MLLSDGLTNISAGNAARTTQALRYRALSIPNGRDPCNLVIKSMEKGFRRKVIAWEMPAVPSVLLLSPSPEERYPAPALRLGAKRLYRMATVAFPGVRHPSRVSAATRYRMYVEGQALRGGLPDRLAKLKVYGRGALSGMLQVTCIDDIAMGAPGQPCNRSSYA
ncbi:hypothetical protein CBM2585_A150007 [Cupriavidus taiwanensis]|nr:hypothetical protein CBM2585_A150007 [Cupriavidus taiwanensis]